MNANVEHIDKDLGTAFSGHHQDKSSWEGLELAEGSDHCLGDVGREANGRATAGL